MKQLIALKSNTIIKKKLRNWKKLAKYFIISLFFLVLFSIKLVKKEIKDKSRKEPKSMLQINQLSGLLLFEMIKKLFFFLKMLANLSPFFQEKGYVFFH